MLFGDVFFSSQKNPFDFFEAIESNIFDIFYYPYLHHLLCNVSIKYISN
jgi:hypothetical protein